VIETVIERENAPRKLRGLKTTSKRRPSVGGAAKLLSAGKSWSITRGDKCISVGG
jgi:hypothetical protein